MTAATSPADYNHRRGETSARHAALSEASARVRVRNRRRVPVEHILLVGASILFPLGVVLILLGWYGAAHTGRLYAQIDYLISGGLLGVALTAAGGFMYFGYWLSRQLSESRRQNALTLQAIERLEHALDGKADRVASRGASPTDRNGGPPPSVQPAPVEATPANGSRPSRTGRPRTSRDADDTLDGVPMLVATPRGSLLHRPDCPIVANKEGIRAVPAGAEGYGYCTMCDSAGVLA